MATVIPQTTADVCNINCLLIHQAYNYVLEEFYLTNERCRTADPSTALLYYFASEQNCCDFLGLDIERFIRDYCALIPNELTPTLQQ